MKRVMKLFNVMLRSVHSGPATHVEVTRKNTSNRVVPVRLGSVPTGVETHVDDHFSVRADLAR
jgi:hypothetical protein